MEREETGVTLPATQEHDKIVELVQSSTQNILKSYNERPRRLQESSEDVELLIRKGYDTKAAMNAAKKLFGPTINISFLAIDGTKSQDEALEMVIFYAGVTLTGIILSL
jgi:hypothetical protein